MSEPTASITGEQVNLYDEGLQHEHTSVRTYILIGVILAVITAVEVGLYYLEAVEAARPFLTPALLALSAMKFALVVLFFMHLKFESKIFSGMFYFGLAVSGALMIALIVIYLFTPASAPSPNALGIGPAF